MVYLQFKKEKDIDYHFISNGGTLFLIKFLHEHKQIIKNFIKSNPKKVDIKKFLNKLKKLVQYDFKTEEYTFGTPSEYISDILFEILHFQYGQNFRVKEIFERNMTKDYLYILFHIKKVDDYKMKYNLLNFLILHSKKFEEPYDDYRLILFFLSTLLLNKYYT